jgi:hypothetical protein
MLGNMERSVVLKILKGSTAGGETSFSYEVVIGAESFTTHDIAHAQKIASEHARPGIYKVEGQGGEKKRGRKTAAKSAAPKKPAAKKTAAKKPAAKKKE